MGTFSSVNRVCILSYTGFQLGFFPFSYLGVPIFKGRVNQCHIAPIMDKILVNLFDWKGLCLSVAGRLLQVKYGIHNMLIYTINIYKWPTSSIKCLEKSCRNFRWKGSITNKKLCVVSWKKSCQPFSKGGLGLRSLIWQNEVANLKLMFEMFNNSEDWEILLRNRVLKTYGFIKYHIFSSIWTSIKVESPNLLSNSCWSLGSGSIIAIWTDSWTSDLLINDKIFEFLDLKGINPRSRVTGLHSQG